MTLTSARVPRPGLLRTLLTTTALAVAVGVLVAALGGEDAAGQGGVERYDLIGTPTSFVVGGAAGEPAGEPQLAPGSFFAFTERLTRGGRRFAGNAGTCTVVTAEQLRCAITTTLPGGTLQVDGLSAPAGVVTLAITGGTGRYRGARGEVRVDTRPEQDRLSFRIARR